MIKIGDYNTLKVVRNVDFGAYLDAGNGVEILLPAKYIDHPLHPGDEVKVFVYNDSEDRPVATTETPYAKVGEFAYLQVADVNKFGAFLDWGIPSKQLLVPFSEQKIRLSRGMVTLVYIYVDHNSGRIVASAKIEKFLGNVFPDYSRGRKVVALVYRHTEMGYKAIVDNRYHGMLYESDLFRTPVIGEPVIAYVKQVRPDGKIDLLLHGGDDGRIGSLASTIMKLLENAGGSLPLCDSSSPEEIKQTVGCSKKDFKKALGALYRQHRILISSNGISLI